MRGILIVTNKGQAMSELAVLIAPAVLAAAAYLGEKTADGAATSFGKSVFNWLKNKLSGSADKSFEEFEGNPQSEQAREKLKQRLAARLAEDPKLAADFATMMKERPLNSGIQTNKDHATGIQIVGSSGNFTFIQK